MLPGLEIIYFLKYFLESVLWSYSQLALEKDMHLELVQSNLITYTKKQQPTIIAQVNTKMISQNSFQSHFQETTGSFKTPRLNYKFNFL